jgi:adenosylhomocysteine nucleosidase
MERARLILVVCIFIFLFINGVSSAEEGSLTGIMGASTEEIMLLEGKITNGQERHIEGIRFVAGEMQGRRVVLARTGVGKVNSAMVTTLLLEHFAPSEVVVTGLAGGLNPDLLPGDIVIAERTAQHDLGSVTSDGLRNWGVRNPITGARNPVFFPADARLLELAEKSCQRVTFEEIRTDETNRVPQVITGVVVTGDVFVSSSAKRLQLRQDLQADAVEMEGAAAAQICWQQGIPCLVVRCLSDIADESADQDYRDFYEIAARNSAMLVADLVEQLAAEESPEDE